MGRHAVSSSASGYGRHGRQLAADVELLLPGLQHWLMLELDIGLSAKARRLRCSGRLETPAAASLQPLRTPGHTAAATMHSIAPARIQRAP